MEKTLIKELLDNKKILRELVKLNSEIVIHKNLKVIFDDNSAFAFTNLFQNIETTLPIFDFNEFLNVLSCYENYEIINEEIDGEKIQLKFKKNNKTEEFVYPLADIERFGGYNDFKDVTLKDFLDDSRKICTFELKNIDEINSLIGKASIESFYVKIKKSKISIVLTNSNGTKFDKSSNLDSEQLFVDEKGETLFPFSIDKIKGLMNADYIVTLFEKSTEDDEDDVMNFLHFEKVTNDNDKFKIDYLITGDEE